MVELPLQLLPSPAAAAAAALQSLLIPQPASATLHLPTPPSTPPAGGGGGGNPSQVRSPLSASQSLINFGVDTAALRSSSFKMGVPVPEVHPVFSAAQKKQFAVESAANEVRFPVMNVTF